MGIYGKQSGQGISHGLIVYNECIATTWTWVKNGLKRECARCGNAQKSPMRFLGNYFEPESYQAFEWFIVMNLLKIRTVGFDSSFSSWIVHGTEFHWSTVSKAKNACHPSSRNGKNRANQNQEPRMDTVDLAESIAKEASKTLPQTPWKWTSGPKKSTNQLILGSLIFRLDCSRLFYQ